MISRFLHDVKRSPVLLEKLFLERAAELSCPVGEGGQGRQRALQERKQPVPQVVPARATGPQVQGRAGPGRSRRSETPQDGYHNGRACVLGTGPAVLL